MLPICLMNCSVSYKAIPSGYLISIHTTVIYLFVFSSDCSILVAKIKLEMFMNKLGACLIFLKREFLLNIHVRARVTLNII